MKLSIKMSAVALLASAIMPLVSVHAQDTVYLPVVASTDHQFSTPIQRPPVDMMSDTYSLDIKFQATEGRAIDYVDAAPRATSTITDVLPANVDLGDLRIDRGNGWTYSYNTKTIHQSCFIAKVYFNAPGDKFATVTGSACYDQLDPALNPDEQYSDVLQSIGRLVDMIDPAPYEYITIDLAKFNKP